VLEKEEGVLAFLGLRLSDRGKAVIIILGRYLIYRSGLIENRKSEAIVSSYLTHEAMYAGSKIYRLIYTCGNS
jgi:hypothetical protein